MSILRASVQYNDFTGTTAADNHDHHGLSSMAKKFGVDTDKYFVVGLEIYVGETRGDEVDHPDVYFLAVDARQVGGSVEGISQYLAGHGGELPYVRFPVEITLNDALQAFKRFRLVLLNRHMAPLNSAEEQAEGD